jgi:hypothetical protein
MEQTLDKFEVCRQGHYFSIRFQYKGQSHQTHKWLSQEQAEAQARLMARSLGASAAVFEQTLPAQKPLLVEGSTDHMLVTQLRALALRFRIRGAGRMRRHQLVEVLKPLLEQTPVGELE